MIELHIIYGDLLAWFMVGWDKVGCNVHTGSLIHSRHNHTGSKHMQVFQSMTFPPATIAPMMNANVKSNPNPDSDLNPYLSLNPKPNH